MMKNYRELEIGEVLKKGDIVIEERPGYGKLEYPIEKITLNCAIANNDNRGTKRFAKVYGNDYGPIGSTTKVYRKRKDKI